MFMSKVIWWLFEGAFNDMARIADWVGDSTGSESARIGAICVVFPVGCLFGATGVVLAVLSAPFYVAYAVIRLFIAGADALARKVRHG